MPGCKPDIHCEALHPTIKTPDVTATAEYYRDKLGFKVDFLWGDPPVHAGVSLGAMAIHFSQDPPTPEGFWIYLVINDVDALYRWYQSNDVHLRSEPKSQPWGMREFIVEDPNGYLLRFGQHDFRSGEPVKVERVERTVRIEKRLATLLDDLVQHKGMTLGELLEETLLHSFEPAPGLEGQAVTSPHTGTTMRLIDELKRKYDIAYDTHTCYRFTE